MIAPRTRPSPSRLVRWLACCLFAGAIVAGCTCGSSDLNGQCHLVRLGPDGGSLDLREYEIPDGGKTDFISFGATDCQDLVCLRSSGDPRNSDPNAVALGYCSTPCNALSRSNQCQSASGAQDQDPKTRLSCRPILLDQITIDAICTADAGACLQYFANTRSPYFCARGGGDSGF